MAAFLGSYFKRTLPHQLERGVASYMYTKNPCMFNLIPTTAQDYDARKTSRNLWRRVELILYPAFSHIYQAHIRRIVVPHINHYILFQVLILFTCLSISLEPEDIMSEQPTIKLLNPYTPMAFLPPELAIQTTNSTYILVGSTAVGFETKSHSSDVHDQTDILAYDLLGFHVGSPGQHP